MTYHTCFWHNNCWLTLLLFRIYFQLSKVPMAPGRMSAAPDIVITMLYCILKKQMHLKLVKAVTHWIPTRYQKELFHWFIWWRIQISWFDITLEMLWLIFVSKPEDSMTWLNYARCKRHVLQQNCLAVLSTIRTVNLLRLKKI